MERGSLKSTALIAVAVLGSACGAEEIGAGDSTSDTSNGAPRAATSLDDGGVNNEVRQSEVGLQPERPWADNTGASDPGALKPSGSLTITTDGALVQNVDVTGIIKIDADNVTIRNFRVKATSSYGIQIVNGHRGIVLEDGEILGMSSAGILGVGFTARRLYIHESQGDAIKAQGSGGPTLVEYCFMEKLGMKDGSHADGNQTVSGSNITFRYNNIWMPVSGTPNYPGAPYKSNAAFMLEGSISNFVIEGNWLNGGNYSINTSNMVPTTGVSVRNNIFGRDYRYGPKNGSFSQWSGNTWEDNGDPI